MTIPVLVLLLLNVVTLAFAARYARLEGQRAREVAWLRRRLSGEDGAGESGSRAARREVAEALRARAIVSARQGFSAGAAGYLDEADQIERKGA